tara:strand:- start:177 stop:668 length:492 start_codon:yes stop_codon:yes gene_type:complete
MNLEDLEKNEIVKTAVENIISDENFKKKCETNFKQIFDDGKVDSDDIPVIINLILTIYNNHNKIRVKPENTKPVFMLLISKLLNEFKGDIEIDQTLIMLMLEPQIDLLLTSVSAVKTLSCCGSKPKRDDEENTLTKIRLNKLERQKQIDKFEQETGILPDSPE